MQQTALQWRDLIVLVDGPHDQSTGYVAVKGADLEQEGAFVVVEVDGGHLHDQQRPNDMSKTVPQARKVFLKLPDVVLLRCVHTSQVLLGSGDQFSTGFRFPDHHPYRMM